MNRANARWYFVALGIALALPGLRALTWSGTARHDLEDSAIAEGKMLFAHEWKERDPLANGGDGLGPVYNATSCVACHGAPSLGGAGGLRHNVTMYTIAPLQAGGATQTGVVHVYATSPRHQETLKKVDPDLPPIAQPTLEQLGIARRSRRAEGIMSIDLPSTVVLSQRNTPALYGAKLIDELPERVIIAQEKQQRLRWGLAHASREDHPVGRAQRLPDGRVGKFGWKAQSPSLLTFVQAACANEMGLGNPGNAQPTPLLTNYAPTKLDLTTQQCEQMTTFIASLPRPLQRVGAAEAERSQAAAGQALFVKIGCADCHTPSLGGIDGLYSDLLLHRMGRGLQGSGFYYGQAVPGSGDGSLPRADEWRTPPLWGVADSAPYLHDGRAATLEEAIELHGGQAARAAGAFSQLVSAEQAWLIAFLKTLRAP